MRDDELYALLGGTFAVFNLVYVASTLWGHHRQGRSLLASIGVFNLLSNVALALIMAFFFVVAGMSIGW